MTDTGKRSAKAAAVLFRIGLTCELAIVLLQLSDYSLQNEGMLFRGTFVLFFLSALLSWVPEIRGGRTGRGELLFLAAFLALGAVSWRCSGRSEILRTVTFLAALRGTDIRREARYAFFVTLSGCLLLLFLAAAGIFGRLSLTMDYGRGSVETRWCFGLGHPNAAHCMAAMLVIFALYLFGEHMRLTVYAALLAGNAVLFLFTKSNTGVLVTAFALLLSLLFREVPKAGKGNTVYILTELMLAALLFLSFAAAVWGDALPLLARLDGPLNGRIATLRDTTFHEGTLFTWRWFSDRSNDSYFDLGWVRLFYWYGVIPGLSAVALLYALLRRVRIRKDTASLVMLASFFVYTFMEAHLVSVYLGRNYGLFVLACYAPELFGGAAQRAGTGREHE
ncbi:MAG: hypothetical protein LKJ76_02690 [Lachnospiraceae bacterium]|jgi:hypothetical protein|nr:hypothetical protein [Lachnospiraceae bacterium]